MLSSIITIVLVGLFMFIFFYFGYTLGSMKREQETIHREKLKTTHDYCSKHFNEYNGDLTWNIIRR